MTGDSAYPFDTTARPITGAGHRRVRGLRGEFADQAVGIGGDIVGRLDHQPLQRPAIRRNPLLQALLHPLHDQRVLLHARDRVGALARRQVRNKVEAGVALLVEIENLDRVGKEQLEPGEVVAHVFDQLVVARRMRAMRLVDQQPAIGGAIERRRLPPRRRQRLVIAEHGFPCGRECGGSISG